MKTILESPAKALGLGCAITLAILLGWLATAGADRIGLASFLLRFVHVLAAMVWIGMIWFVNFIQLAAVRDADDAGRAALMKWVVPHVAATFRHASHLTIVSGILLLITTGYLLDRLVFTSAVYIPPLRNMLLWGATLGGLAMWTFVHMLIWPALRTVLGETTADAEAKAAARARVATYARWNLVLMTPVTFAMIAAAHLY